MRATIQVVGVAKGTKMGPNYPYVCLLGMSRGECLKTTKETSLNLTNHDIDDVLGQTTRS